MLCRRGLKTVLDSKDVDKIYDLNSISVSAISSSDTSRGR